MVLGFHKLHNKIIQRKKEWNHCALYIYKCYTVELYGCCMVCWSIVGIWKETMAFGNAVRKFSIIFIQRKYLYTTERHNIVSLIQKIRDILTRSNSSVSDKLSFINNWFISSCLTWNVEKIHQAQSFANPSDFDFLTTTIPDILDNSPIFSNRF